MGTEHDSTALLRGDDVEDVVKEDGFGVFLVQILEGPTDNPIRVVGPGGVRPSYQEYYTFGIEGAGWNVLVDMLQLIGDARRDIPYHLSCFISLVRHFPENWGLLDYGKVDQDGRHSECGG